MPCRASEQFVGLSVERVCGAREEVAAQASQARLWREQSPHCWLVWPPPLRRVGWEQQKLARREPVSVCPARASEVWKAVVAQDGKMACLLTRWPPPSPWEPRRAVGARELVSGSKMP